MSKHQISEYPITKANHPWQRLLRRFFSQLWVEIVIGILVIISVALTLLEFALEVRLKTGDSASFPLLPHLTSWHLEWIMFINHMITGLFVFELTMRYVAARSKTKFFREFWIDILATIPIFRVFRSARALRLLRLIRIFRLVGVLTRVSSHFPHIFRRGAVEFIVISGFLVVVILFGTASMMHFENLPNVEQANGDANIVAGIPDNVEPVEEFNMEKSFWFSVYTMFSGEPIPTIPKTFYGKMVSVVLMFMGLTVFAVIAGTVSAFMSDRIRVEARVVEWDELSDHIIICGWTPKTETIVREYRANKTTKNTAIVIICLGDHEQADIVSKEVPRIYFVDDDFTKISALKRAGIEKAKTCLVLSDLTGGRSEQDADARTILAALTVEKINPDVYTCAELINRSYSTHLEMGKVNNFVVSEEYGAYMLAQASIHQGLAGVMNELLSYQKGNEFYRCEIPSDWAGQTFDSKLAELKSEHNAILVGVHPVDGEMLLNPNDYVFSHGDEVVAICRGGLKIC